MAGTWHSQSPASSSTQARHTTAIHTRICISSLTISSPARTRLLRAQRTEASAIEGQTPPTRTTSPYTPTRRRYTRTRLRASSSLRVLLSPTHFITATPSILLWLAWIPHPHQVHPHHRYICTNLFVSLVLVLFVFVRSFVELYPIAFVVLSLKLHLPLSLSLSLSSGSLASSRILLPNAYCNYHYPGCHVYSPLVTLYSCLHHHPPSSSYPTILCVLCTCPYVIC